MKKLASEKIFIKIILLTIESLAVLATRKISKIWSNAIGNKILLVL